MANSKRDPPSMFWALSNMCVAISQVFTTVAKSFSDIIKAILHSKLVLVALIIYALVWHGQAIIYTVVIILPTGGFFLLLFYYIYMRINSSFQTTAGGGAKNAKNDKNPKNTKKSKNAAEEEDSDEEGSQSPPPAVEFHYHDGRSVNIGRDRSRHCDYTGVHKSLSWNTALDDLQPSVMGLQPERLAFQDSTYRKSRVKNSRSAHHYN